MVLTSKLRQERIVLELNDCLFYFLPLISAKRKIPGSWMVVWY